MPPCRSADTPSRILCVEEGTLERESGDTGPPCTAVQVVHCTAEGTPLAGPQHRRDSWIMKRSESCSSSLSIISSGPPKPSPLSQPIHPALGALGSGARGREPASLPVHRQTQGPWPQPLHLAQSAPGKALLAQDRRPPPAPGPAPWGSQLTPRAGPHETRGPPTSRPLRRVVTHSGGCAEGWLSGRGLAWRGAPGARRSHGRLRETRAAIRVGAGRAGQTDGGTQRAQLTYDHDRRPGQQGEEREEHGLVGVQDVLEEPGAICSPGTRSPKRPQSLRAVPMLSGPGAGSGPSQPGARPRPSLAA